MEKRNISIDSRTSDAVALALRFGCPIYITEEILEKAGITITPTETEASSETETDSLYRDRECKIRKLFR